MSDSMCATGLSVWLTSKTTQGQKLDDIVKWCALKTRTTIFPWHLTVIGGIDLGNEGQLARVLEDVALCTSAHAVIVTGVDSVPNNEQKVCFLKIRTDFWLRMLRDQLVIVFPQNNKRHYWHGSLYYGRQESLCAEVTQRLGGVGERVCITSMSLWSTQGRVPDWYQLAEYDFKILTDDAHSHKERKIR